MMSHMQESYWLSSITGIDFDFKMSTLNEARYDLGKMKGKQENEKKKKKEKGEWDVSLQQFL